MPDVCCILWTSEKGPPSASLFSNFYGQTTPAKGPYRSSIDLLNLLWPREAGESSSTSRLPGQPYNTLLVHLHKLLVILRDWQTHTLFTAASLCDSKQYQQYQYCTSDHIKQQPTLSLKRHKIYYSNRTNVEHKVNSLNTL